MLTPAIQLIAVACSEFLQIKRLKFSLFMKHFFVFKGIKKSINTSSCTSRHLPYTLCLCPAAEQCFQNTPCPAVNFFFNFLLIITKPSLCGWKLHYLHRSVSFCELGNRYAGIHNFEARRELLDRKLKILRVRQSNIFPNIKSLHSIYSSSTILGGLIIVYMAKEYDYQFSNCREL